MNEQKIDSTFPPTRFGKRVENAREDVFERKLKIIDFCAKGCWFVRGLDEIKLGTKFRMRVESGERPLKWVNCYSTLGICIDFFCFGWEGRCDGVSP